MQEPNWYRAESLLAQEAGNVNLRPDWSQAESALATGARDWAACMTEPFTLYRPRLFPDGNQWCALYGEDLQSGVAGFGNSPSEAVTAFNRAWYEKLPTVEAQP